MNPLVDLLLAAGRENPGRAWVEQPDGPSWTHGDLVHVSAALAQALVARGVRPGDRVVVQEPTSPEVLALHLACARVGGVWVPLNTAYTAGEVAGLVAVAEPALLVGAAPVDLGVEVAALADLVAESSTLVPEDVSVPRELDDPAGMLFTSGTTGRPKGAVLSHGNLVANARTLVDAWGFTGDDVVLHALPLFHTHGLFVAAHCVLASGASMVLLERFDPRTVVQTLPRCSVLMGVPTHYTRLLADPGFDREATAAIRLLTSGSAPMLVSTHQAVRERTGHTVLERYGMTETCILTSNPLEGTRTTGSVGPPLPGVRVRLSGDDDSGVGDVEVKGPNVFAGYWRRDDATREAFTDDGWFRTGDLGRLDDDGYLHLVGRSKDLVISGGLNVHPTEVEQAVDSLPGVAESAVVGMPDPDLGEIVVAVVVPVPGATVEESAVRFACRERLAGFKVPKRVVVVDVLPRNAMGKVEKARLREQLAQNG